ncbi:hypothetical protein HY469_00015 [Candidatus Roizmanbacteria bacterium]|nr:hypothetical protein [Candidatus Roizmanbacteria bacterium]
MEPYSAPIENPGSNMPHLPPKRVAVISGIVTLILLISIGVWFFYQQVILTPQFIVQKMMTNLSKTSSLTYHGSFSMDMQIIEGQQPSWYSTTVIDGIPSPFFWQSSDHPDRLNAELVFEGSLDTHDPDRPEGEIQFSINNPESLDIVEYAFDIKYADQLWFGRFTKIPTFGEGILFTRLPSSLAENEWISGDFERIAAIYSLDMFEPREIEPYMELLFQSDEIREYLPQFIPLNQLQKMPDETINGRSTYHLQGEIDKNALIETIRSYPELDTKTKNQLISWIEPFITPPVDIWIGKQDFLPYRIRMKMGLGIPEENKYLGDMILDITVDSYNQPVAVAAPWDITTTSVPYEGKTLGISVDQIMEYGHFPNFEPLAYKKTPENYDMYYGIEGSENEKPYIVLEMIGAKNNLSSITMTVYGNRDDEESTGYTVFALYELLEALDPVYRDEIDWLAEEHLTQSETYVEGHDYILTNIIKGRKITYNYSEQDYTITLSVTPSLEGYGDYIGPTHQELNKYEDITVLFEKLGQRGEGKETIHEYSVRIDNLPVEHTDEYDLDIHTYNTEEIGVPSGTVTLVRRGSTWTVSDAWEGTEERSLHQVRVVSSDAAYVTIQIETQTNEMLSRPPHNTDIALVYITLGRVSYDKWWEDMDGFDELEEKDLVSPSRNTFDFLEEEYRF